MVVPGLGSRGEEGGGWFLVYPRVRRRGQGVGGGWCGRCGWVVAGQEVVLQGVGRLSRDTRWWAPLLLSAGWDELTTLGRGSVDPGVREEGGGVMRCERYARGLPRVVRRTLANLPTCRLVGKSESWRVGGVRAGGGGEFLVYRRGKRKEWGWDV